MKPTDKTPVAVLGFGLGGHHEEMKNSYLSGYDRPHNWRPDDDKDYTHTVVIDKRPAVEKDFSAAFRSPLLGVGLEGIEKFSLGRGDSRMVATFAENSPTIAGCVVLQTTTALDAIGPLDRVGLNLYTAWWKTAGARIGKVNAGGRIVWEDGQVQPRDLTAAEMAAAIGVEIEEVGSFVRDFQILRDGEVIRKNISQYCLRNTLADLGAPLAA